MPAAAPWCRKGGVHVKRRCVQADTQLSEADVVCLDGAPLRYQQFVYLMVNKPAGVVSAREDARIPRWWICWGRIPCRGATPVLCC